MADKTSLGTVLRKSALEAQDLNKQIELDNTAIISADVLAAKTKLAPMMRLAIVGSTDNASIVLLRLEDDMLLDQMGGEKPHERLVRPEHQELWAYIQAQDLEPFITGVSYGVGFGKVEWPAIGVKLKKTE